jgi:hypothetical protein
MKYQINESRLDEVIMSYLDSVLFGIEEKYNYIGGGMYQFWGKGNYEMIYVDESNDNMLSMGINNSIWGGLRRMFNLTPTQTDEYFIKWIEENLGLNPEDIYTF